MVVIRSLRKYLDVRQYNWEGANFIINLTFEKYRIS